jgi:hypothetical protein
MGHRSLTPTVVYVSQVKQMCLMLAQIQIILMQIAVSLSTWPSLLTRKPYEKSHCNACIGSKDLGQGLGLMMECVKCLDYDYLANRELSLHAHVTEAACSR